jgi:hypothetical protein
MPAIFKRFTEKEPKEWRQIYKVASGPTLLRVTIPMTIRFGHFGFFRNSQLFSPIIENQIVSCFVGIPGYTRFRACGGRSPRPHLHNQSPSKLPVRGRQWQGRGHQWYVTPLRFSFCGAISGIVWKLIKDTHFSNCSSQPRQGVCRDVE